MKHVCSLRTAASCALLFIGGLSAIATFVFLLGHSSNQTNHEKVE